VGHSRNCSGLQDSWANFSLSTANSYVDGCASTQMVTDLGHGVIIYSYEKTPLAGLISLKIAIFRVFLSFYLNSWLPHRPEMSDSLAFLGKFPKL
jgi:hypothetical protein